MFSDMFSGGDGGISSTQLDRHHRQPANGCLGGTFLQRSKSAALGPKQQTVTPFCAATKEGYILMVGPDGQIITTLMAQLCFAKGLASSDRQAWQSLLLFAHPAKNPFLAREAVVVLVQHSSARQPLFLLIASDGLWHAADESSVIEIVRRWSHVWSHA